MPLAATAVSGLIGAGCTVLVFGSVYVIIKGGKRLYEIVYTSLHHRVILTPEGSPVSFACALNILTRIRPGDFHGNGRQRITVPNGGEGRQAWIPSASPKWSVVYLEFDAEVHAHSWFARMLGRPDDTHIVRRRAKIKVRWFGSSSNPNIPAAIEFQSWKWSWTSSFQALEANLANNFRSTLGDELVAAIETPPEEMAEMAGGGGGAGAHAGDHEEEGAEFPTEPAGAFHGGGGGLRHRGYIPVATQ